MTQQKHGRHCKRALHSNGDSKLPLFGLGGLRVPTGHGRLPAWKETEPFQCSIDPLPRCQHDQASPTSFTREFGVGPLLALAGLDKNSTISVSCPVPCRPVGFQRRYEGGVDGKLSPRPKCESVCHDFQSPSIQCIEVTQIHVADEHVRGDSCPCFATDLCSRTFQREPTPPQDPCHLARCAMVAKRVELAATSASTQGQGKGKRRQSKRRNDCASILITLDVGSTVKEADARGPC